MPTRDTDTRTITLVDIPLVSRLAERGIVLNSELGFTRASHGGNGALLSSLLLPQRSLHTLLTRSDKHQVVGQFRLKPDETNAHIIYVAPGLDLNTDDTAWLHVLDAMAREAGKHGAHNLVAEIDEDNCLFETMRTVGFAVYARQEIWRRNPGDYPPADDALNVADQTEDDVAGIQALFAQTVPSLVHQVAGPPADARGLIYRTNDRIEAYMAVVEGKHGIFMTPYLHPDINGDLCALFDSAVRRSPRAGKLPVYVCVRRHQDWYTFALERLGFEPVAQQAVMVRHIAAGVRHTSFSLLEHALPATPIKPPTGPLRQQSILDVELREPQLN